MHVNEFKIITKDIEGESLSLVFTQWHIITGLPYFAFPVVSRVCLGKGPALLRGNGPSPLLRRTVRRKIGAGGVIGTSYRLTPHERRREWCIYGSMRSCSYPQVTMAIVNARRMWIGR